MLGRPQSSEAAPYYFNYINLVPGDDALVVLENQLEETRALFATISEEKSLYRYERSKWSIRQLLNHVSDTERAFVFRALWFARGFDTPLPSFDQNISTAGAEAERIDFAEHVEEFRRVRLATISLFRHLPPNAWMRTGTASGYRFTVRSLAFITAGHTAHHLQVLRERYL